MDEKEFNDAEEYFGSDIVNYYDANQITIENLKRIGFEDDGDLCFDLTGLISMSYNEKHNFFNLYYDGDFICSVYFNSILEIEKFISHFITLKYYEKRTNIK